MSEIPAMRPIGGFLGLELPSRGEGLRGAWGVTEERLCFADATSALAALLAGRPQGQVWLPAYICPKFAAAVPAHRAQYYPSGAALTPDVAYLHERLRQDDVCIAVDYFGRAPPEEFRSLAAARADVLFVEDCAQALDTGAPAWGDWRIFSPRKLVGVPDGGMLVPISAKADSTGIESHPNLNAAERARPQLLRFEDRAEVSNAVWHRANQEKEAASAIGSSRMSRLTWEILGLLDVEPISARRKANFAILAEALGAWALLPDSEPTFAPLAYPVVLPEERRDEVRERLIAERVFPVVHWARLPSPPEAFPDEHRLSRQLLSLPCDHRYEAADMARLAAVFTASANASIQVSAGVGGEGSRLRGRG